MQPVANRNQVAAFQASLDRGEAEAIALALELNATLLLIDESPGRAIAKQQGLNITGVLGVLLEAKSRQLVVSIKPLLNQLINDMGFWISRSVYQTVLQVAAEEYEA
jgi:hypothetical protein